MSDQYGQRQLRNQRGPQAPPIADPMSPEHRQIEADRAARQQGAARDPELTGEAAKGRVRT
jgi:hypothetical protein